MFIIWETLNTTLKSFSYLVNKLSKYFFKNFRLNIELEMYRKNSAKN